MTYGVTKQSLVPLGALIGGALAAFLIYQPEFDVTPYSGVSSDRLPLETEGEILVHQEQMDGVAATPGAAPSAIGFNFSGRMAGFRLASRIDDSDLAESAILAALDRTPSLERDVEIELLFVRLFELDPQRAVSLVQRLNVPGSLISSIFEGWTRVDSAAALTLLGEIVDPWMERKLAFALLERAGNDMSSVALILAEGQTLDEAGLQMAAVAQRAKSDLAGAIADVTRIKNAEARAFAMAEIARVSAARDPVDGFEQAQALPNAEQRVAFVVELYREWARRDFQGLLAHLGTRDPDQIGIESVVQRALQLGAESAPLLTLEFAEQIGGQLGFVAASAAIEALAAVDPAAALQYMESEMTMWPMRTDMLTASLAAGYARADVDAALSWVSSLNPPNISARNAVMTTMASLDLMRAVETELVRPSDHRFVEFPPAWLQIPMLSDLDNPAVVADSIVAGGDGAHANQMLLMVVSRWGDLDPYAAIAWLLSRQDVPGNVVQAATDRLVRGGHAGLNVVTGGAPDRADRIREALAEVCISYPGVTYCD